MILRLAGVQVLMLNVMTMTDASFGTPFNPCTKICRRSGSLVLQGSSQKEPKSSQVAQEQNDSKRRGQSTRVTIGPSTIPNFMVPHSE